MSFFGTLKHLIQVFYVTFTDHPKPEKGRYSDEYTLAEVEALPDGSSHLLGIALGHHDEEIANLATLKIVNGYHLHIIAIYPGASILARMTAARRSRKNQDLMVEIAIRDDDAALAIFTAQLVEDPQYFSRLFDSKYESVRLIAAMKTRDPEILEKMLEEPNERIREHVEKKLRSRTAN